MKHLMWLVGVVLVAVSSLTPPRRVIRESDLRPVLLRPGVVSLMAKSQKPLLIDLYWLRALNAIGDDESVRKNKALYEYGVFLSEIDPRFREVYTHVGLNVYHRVGRHWVNADLADDIFRRGLEVFPNDYRLLSYRGFNLFARLKRYEEAADLFERASHLPQAPRYYLPLSLRLRAQGAGAEAALVLARQLYAEATDEQTKAMLARRIQELGVEVYLEQIDRASAAFEAKNGYRATTLQPLIGEGLYKGPLLDDQGGVLSVDAEGKGYSTSLDQRIKAFKDGDDE